MSTPHPVVPLAERYGTPASPRRRRVLLAVATIAVVGALAWVVWAGLGQARADVRSSDVGFRILDNQSVEVTYDVGKDPNSTAICTLQAFDRGKGTVGLAQVTVGPREQKVTRNVATVRTSALALTAVVRDCVLRR